jgi:hypothetical protein
MQWAMLAVGTIVVVESFVRLPLMARVADLMRSVRKITRTLSSNAISDHWKERVLPIYAFSVFTNSILIFALVLVAVAPMILIGVVNELAGVAFFKFLAEPVAIAGSTFVAIVYVALRNRFANV